ncbi:MAG: beta-lactamase family protein [Chitinophagaceae bacterium]|nr:beta-lactamase family protein [Chitinophagaceae bacterium]
MKKLLLFITLCATLIVVKAQNTFQQSVTQIIQTANEQVPFSGTVLIAEKGKIRYYEAFGYRTFADSIAIQANDVFELASVSKQFTAMIILMLKEKGLLQLDDGIDKYVSVPYKGITIRHLLTHTSGLPDYQAIMDQYWDKSKVAGNPDIITYLNQYAPPAKFTPGEKYDYSNTGYVLLASIAEKVSGKDFIQLSREWIFQPLKMRETNIRTAAEKATLSNFALGHIYVPFRKAFIRADSFPSSNYTIWLGNRKGPGRISSTATDLLKWDQALYSNKLISAASLAEAFQPMRLNNGQFSQYGFGWDLETDSTLGKIVAHNGDNPGYKTMIVRCIDTQQTIIVLCNNAHPQFNNIIAQLQRLLAAYKLAKL